MAILTDSTGNRILDSSGNAQLLDDDADPSTCTCCGGTVGCQYVWFQDFTFTYSGFTITGGSWGSPTLAGSLTPGAEYTGPTNTWLTYNPPPGGCGSTPVPHQFCRLVYYQTTTQNPCTGTPPSTPTAFSGTNPTGCGTMSAVQCSDVAPYAFAIAPPP